MLAEIFPAGAMSCPHWNYQGLGNEDPQWVRITHDSLWEIGDRVSLCLTWVHWGKKHMVCGPAAVSRATVCATDTGNDTRQPREGPAKVWKYKVAPESSPVYILDVWRSTSVCWFHCKGYFQSFSHDFMSHTTLSKEKAHSVLLRFLSSVKVLVLNELNKCRQRSTKSSTL